MKFSSFFQVNGVEVSGSGQDAASMLNTAKQPIIVELKRRSQTATNGGNHQHYTLNNMAGSVYNGGVYNLAAVQAVQSGVFIQNL